MKQIYFLALIFITAFVFPVYSQRSGAEITVKSIRQLPKVKERANKTFVLIELETSNPKGFYVGGLYWCLYIGNLTGIGETTFTGTEVSRGGTRLFLVAEADWKKLKNGDPMVLTWGCSDRLERTDAERKNNERMKASAFAFLNKKMLRKQR